MPWPRLDSGDRFTRDLLGYGFVATTAVVLGAVYQFGYPSLNVDVALEGPPPAGVHLVARLTPAKVYRPEAPPSRRGQVLDCPAEREPCSFEFWWDSNALLTFPERHVLELTLEDGVTVTRLGEVQLKAPGRRVARVRCRQAGGCEIV